jgi:hypothetical protein
LGRWTILTDATDLTDFQTPWNDQFFHLGSFAIPRGFSFGTLDHFNRRDRFDRFSNPLE